MNIRIHALIAVALGATLGCAGAEAHGYPAVGIGVGYGPAKAAPMQRVVAPFPGAVWMPGYWASDGYRSFWVEGRWVAGAPAWRGPRDYGYGYGNGHGPHGYWRHENERREFEGGRDHGYRR
jgi:hypothetical protein